MTREEREEAIEVFEGMVKTAEIRETFTIPRSVMIRAQKTALEALRVEPCEDCVSRVDVSNAIESVKYFQANELYRVKDITDECHNVVEALPSVNPARKKGEWLIPEGYLGYWICSKCLSNSEEDTAFCPNCGADMREGDGE